MAAKIVPVIMAGGKGTRLWPLSRASAPKQFIQFIGDRTLFQNTLERVSDPELYEAPIVLTNEEFRFLVAEQARELAEKKNQHGLKKYLAGLESDYLRDMGRAGGGAKNAAAVRANYISQAKQRFAAVSGGMESHGALLDEFLGATMPAAAKRAPSSGVQPRG